MIGEPQIRGDTRQVVLALHHPLEGQLYAQGSSELGQGVPGLFTKEPAEMVRGTPEHLRQVDDPRNRRVSHHGCARFVANRRRSRA